MKKKEALGILVRYLILIALSPFILNILYYNLTPLTSYPSFFILNLLYPSSYLIDITTISIQGSHISLIPACIAGAAYYLLLLLNLTTPMPIIKRVKGIFFLFGSFLALNIVRIIIFSILFVQGFQYFDIAHRFVWYIGSTIFVIAIWFANVKIFKIKAIPGFTDIKNLLKEARKSRFK